MKKNLTLLMMLAAFVGILSAQSGPKFNYQAVVRNADTLVYNQDMTVDVTVSDGTNTYSESHDVTSTKNGLVSVIIGGEDASNVNGNLAVIDWSKASITAEFTFNSVSVTSTMPVTPMPYALQAGGALLTTEVIANYMKNTLTTQDAKDILNALVLHNDPLQQELEDTIEVYMKSHKDIAVDVAKAYLDHITADDVADVYDALNANTDAKDALKKLMKRFIISRRDVAKELTIWYLKTATAYDIHRAYDTFQDVPEPTKQAVKDTLISFVRNNHTFLYDFGTYLINNVTEEEAGNAYAWLKLTNTPVKNQLRDTLNHYIDLYLAAHPGYGTVNTTTVDNAVNNYTASHPMVQNCSPAVDICVLKQMYDDLNNAGTPCPSITNVDWSQETTGYQLSCNIDFDLVNNPHGDIYFEVVIYYQNDLNLDPHTIQVAPDYSNYEMSAMLLYSDCGDFSTVTRIDFTPVVEEVSCGSTGTTNVTGTTGQIFIY